MSSVLALTSLAAESRVDAPSAAAADPAVQRVWFALVQSAWGALAVVPTDSTVPVATVADMLVTAGQQHGGRAVRLLDARGAQIGDVHRLSTALKRTGDGNSLVVPLDAPEDNPVALPLARAASAVLIVTRLGHSRLASTRRLIDAVGRECVIGCVLVS